MLENKRILIVGGSSGIGLAVANLASENGAHVIIAARNAQDQLERWPWHIFT